MSSLWSECEKLQMAIAQQRVIRSTSCLVLGWVFSKDRLALFNLTAHELHELYYDRSQRLDRLCVHLHMYLVVCMYC